MLIALAAGCPTAELVVAVDVRTDFAPGVEFVTVRTESSTSREDLVAGGASMRVELGAFRGDDFLDGRRVAELSPIAAGSTYIRVSLLDTSGSIVVDRVTVIDVRENTGVVVVLSRRCAGVRCPGPADDPEETTCSNGQCVRPDCGSGSSIACGAPACSIDADCSAASCAVARCADGTCLVRPSDTLCMAEERCDGEAGCVARCPMEGAECDDGDDCTSDDVCTGGVCAGMPYVCEPTACGTLTCDGLGGCTASTGPGCCGNGTCDTGEDCTSCPADCGAPVQVCDSCRAWDCCVVLGAVTRYDADCSSCTPCDACGMGASCHTCPHPMGGDCRYDTQECNVRFDPCNCRDECP